MGLVAAAVSALLFIFLANFVYSKLWANGLSISIRFSEKVVTEGDKIFLLETLANAKIIPLPWIGAKFQLSRNLVNAGANSRISDDYYRNDLFAILPFQKITRKLPFICARRGFYSVKSIDLICPNLSHTGKMVSHSDCSAYLTVYPRILPEEEQPIPFQDLLGETVSKRAFPPDPFEFKGIRERQPSDSLRDMNFKATAKTGKLMSNTHESTSSRSALLMLNLEPYSSWMPESLQEGAIRIAATVAVELINANVPLRFVTNGLDSFGETADIRSGLGSGHLDSIFDALAHVALEKSSPSFSPMLAGFSQDLKSDQIYILVSAYAKKDLRDEFQRLKSFGADALWISPVIKGESVSADLEVMGGNVFLWEIQREGV